jgi:hypothetical protein
MNQYTIALEEIFSYCYHSSIFVFRFSIMISCGFSLFEMSKLSIVYRSSIVASHTTLFFGAPIWENVDYAQHRSIVSFQL